MRTRQQPSRGPHRPMPSHALLPPDTHPHASALPPRCPTPFRAMPSCPGITLHGNAPLSLPGRRAHAEARTGTQTGAQAGAGPALRQYAAEQKIPPRIHAGKQQPPLPSPTHTSAPPPDTSFPGSSPPDTAPQLHSAPKRASTPASSPATSHPDTPSHSNTPPNRRFRRAFSPANGARHHRPTPHHRTARSAFPSANNRRRSPPPTHTHTRSRPGTRISPGTRIQPKTIRPRRHAAPPPHAVARHLTVPLRQTHARTKKRSTLADASPLFGNVEFVTRPERNACRQLR